MFSDTISTGVCCPRAESREEISRHRGRSIEESRSACVDANETSRSDRPRVSQGRSKKLSETRQSIKIEHKNTPFFLFRLRFRRSSNQPCWRSNSQYCGGNDGISMVKWWSRIPGCLNSDLRSDSEIKD